MSDEQEQQRRHVITVGGEQVDLTDLAPITMGDKKKLKAQGVDFMKYARERALDPEDESKLILYFIRKHRPKTTMEEIDDLPVLVTSSLMQYAMQRAAEVDDPFSTRSTSSVRPTAGASAKSDSAPSTS